MNNFEMMVQAFKQGAPNKFTSDEEFNVWYKETYADAEFVHGDNAAVHYSAARAAYVEGL